MQLPQKANDPLDGAPASALSRDVFCHFSSVVCFFSWEEMAPPGIGWGDRSKAEVLDNGLDTLTCGSTFNTTHHLIERY